MPSPSASVAVTVPIAVWFSSAVKVALEVKLGELSFRLTMVKVTHLVPSGPDEVVA